MHILIFPAGFILWYLAYEAKPIINDEVTLHWEEKNSLKQPFRYYLDQKIHLIHLETSTLLRPINL